MKNAMWGCGLIVLGIAGGALAEEASPGPTNALAFSTPPLTLRMASNDQPPSAMDERSRVDEAKEKRILPVPRLTLEPGEPEEMDPPSGGPPMFTDDTGTPGKGHLELNLLTLGEFKNGERRIEAPWLDINYGPLDRVQLKLEVPYVFSMRTGERTQSALGNIDVGVKYRFYDNEQSGLSLAVYPQFSFNSNQAAIDRGIEDRGFEALLPVIATQNFGRFSVGGEAGVLLRQYERSGLLYGVTGGYNVNDRVQILAEIYGKTLRDLSDHEVLVNLGSRIALDHNKHFKLLLAIGRTVMGENKYVAQVGIQYLY